MTRPVLAFLAVAAAGAAAAQEGFVPPHVAAELGIPPEKLRRVDELAFAANDELIALDATVRRAQLALDRELRSPSPDEARLLQLVESVGLAEIAVRKNRVLLLARVRKVLGEELWARLEAWRVQHPPPSLPPGRGPAGMPALPGPRPPGR